VITAATTAAWKTAVKMYTLGGGLVLVIGQPPKEYHAEEFQQLHAISTDAGCAEQVT